MRAPFWLRRERRSARPLRDVSAASSGNLVVWLALITVLGGVLGGAHGAWAAVLGAGVVLGSALISWGLVLVPALGRRPDPAPALLVGYVVKVALGVVLLVLLPAPAQDGRGWLVAGAVGGVVVMLVTEVWAVSRLRILYFGGDGPSDEGSAPEDRPTPPDAETTGS